MMSDDDNDLRLGVGRLVQIERSASADFIMLFHNPVGEDPVTERRADDTIYLVTAMGIREGLDYQEIDDSHWILQKGMLTATSPRRRIWFTPKSACLVLTVLDGTSLRYLDIESGMSPSMVKVVG